MKVWPLEPKPFLGDSKVVTFETVYYDGRKKDIVRTMNITAPELAQREIEKAIRRGHVVVLRDQESGELVAFEIDANADDDDGDKYAFPHYGTERQARVHIDEFPWEARR